MGKKVTMQQIADHLNVSKYAVSQALSGKKGVSEKTRQRIIETAAAMGYKIKGKEPECPAGNNEKNEISGRQYVLVWISEDHEKNESFWKKVLTGAMAACSQNGWKHVIVALDEQNIRTLDFPEFLDQGACIGALLVGTFPAKTVAQALQFGFPVVLVDHQEPNVEADAVVNDNFQAALLLMQRLVFQGCRSFLFVGSDRRSVSFRERWWGCRMARKELLSGESGTDGSGSLKKWDFPDYPAPSWKAQLSSKLKQLPPDQYPHAFVCANDQIALELLGHLQALGVRVPGQCKVVGIDNIEISSYVRPSLTTVDLSKESLGFRAIEVLQRRIRHPGRDFEKIVLSGRLVPRESG